MRKNILTLFALFTVLCASLAPQSARASHAAGADLIYEWVSDSTYRFYYKFYRDCSGIDEPPSVELCYFNQCNAQNGTKVMNKILFLPGGIPNGSEVSPGCAGSFTTCAGGLFPGYREWWYTTTITLPSRCDYWTFYANINAGTTGQAVGRNPNDNITPSPANTLAPSGIMYIEATLNNKDAQGFSSPYFSVKPVPYVCVNSPIVYSNGPVDPNNDVMRFEMITPRDIPIPMCFPNYTAVNMAFTSGYTLAQPFACNNTFNLNTITSQISFTPALISKNTVSMRANKFRNNVKIGSVMRDIQFQVVQCTAPLPTFTLIQSSITGAQLVNGTIEGGVNKTVNFCFYLKSNPGSILAVTDNHGLIIPTANITYINMGKDSVNGCLSWTPSCADTGLKLIAITVRDSTCQATGSTSVAQTYIVPVNITQVPVITFRKLTICPGDAVTITAASGSAPVSWVSLSGSPVNGTLSNPNSKNPLAKPDVTTLYAARYVLPAMGNNSCYNEDQVLVQVNPARVEITPPGPLAICKPDSVHLSANVVGGTTRLMNLACGVVTTAPGTIPDSAEILPPGTPAQSISNPVSTPFTGTDVTARHQYLVLAGDMRASGMSGGTIKSISFKVSAFTSGTGIFNQFRISLLCTNLTTLNAATGFVSGTVPVYSPATPVTISASGDYTTFNLDVPYNWDTTQNLIVDVCYANATPVSSAYTYYFNMGYIGTLNGYAAAGNICTGTVPTNIVGVPELPQMKFNYTLAPAATDFSYRWQSGNSVFVPSDTVKNPAIFVNADAQVYVSTYDRYGCRLVDTLSIDYSQHGITEKNDSICAGESIQLHPPTEGASYQWYENGYGNTPHTLDCITCASPVATPAVTTQYASFITDANSCVDTFLVNVGVTPLPDIRILVPGSDTTVNYGDQIRLVVTGGVNYVWWPPTGLDNPYTATPIAMPQESTVYTVIGGAEANPRCYGYDTVSISVDYKGNIFIPNAFTPNIDGKNDRFKIVNLTFQKLIEFKIFNRWGQELYSATDNKGWDGTWKNEPQPLGVYYYWARIGYPDGTEKCFKGDFTLVR